MNKVLAILMLLCLTGCGCTRKARVEQYRLALRDTNVILTECQEQNAQKSAMIRRQHAQIAALKKQRRQMGK